MTRDNVLAGIEEFKLTLMFMNFRLKYAVILILQN